MPSMAWSSASSPTTTSLRQKCCSILNLTIISMVLFSLRILFFISTGRLHLLHLLFFPRLSLSLLASWTPWLHFFSCFIFFFFHNFCLSFFDSEQWAPIFFHQFFSCLTSPQSMPTICIFCFYFLFYIFISIF